MFKKILVLSSSLNKDFDDFIKTKPDLTAMLEWIDKNVPSKYLEQIVNNYDGDIDDTT
jgi:hypothetical protein